MIRKINLLLEPLKYLKIQQNFEARLISTTVNLFNESTAERPATSVANIKSKNTLNKAMKSYLERAQQHDEFMKTEKHQFEIGKRHLANMMGENPETFTQDDIDNAIEYLFPSGLYDKRARPLMKPPEEVFPQRKAAEFDETGRPYHFLFYTGRPNLYQVLHDTVEKINELNNFEDTMIRKNLQPDPNLALELSGSQWLDKNTLEQKLVEPVSDGEYSNFLKAMDRLCSLPYSHKAKDFIMEYRKPLMSNSEAFDVIKPQIGPDGRQFVTTYECRRKRAIGNVTIRFPGTGKISINGQDINYFKGIQQREQLLFPLIFTNMQRKVDIEAEVQDGGESGQAGAIRYGIAWGLRSFIDQEYIENMRLAGLLTPDFRIRERKKPGQKGARKKFTWKKR
ncbi:unnamed protein product [Ceutorhynchus assimilis]|uniref:Small ribosomal subunit protein uS9m n=1 Tax=Ceutorhynchus assimilis TaxID=467358 RepID=A0A9N9QRU5_9CUCU|nr:unnamed protein product [Ceutorhynchus assimilis]